MPRSRSFQSLWTCGRGRARTQRRSVLGTQGSEDAAGAAMRCQMGMSIESPQLLHLRIAVEDMRTIVECSPQFGHTEESSKRCRQ